MTADRIPPTADALLAQTDWIRALAQRLIVDPGTADDVAQDAALVALTKSPRDSGALHGWLRRVVRNLALNVRRSETRRDAREAEVAAQEGVEASDEVVARWEIRRRVVAEVLALDEPYRAAILLRFFEGLSVGETAARLDAPEETIRTRTRRGLDLLRGRLASLDDGRGRRGFAALVLLARGEGRGTGALGGGVAMATGTKWVIAAAVMGLLAVGATIAVRAGQPGDPPPAVGGDEAKTATAPKRRESKTTESRAPTGIDLAACDRDRDLHGTVVDFDGKPVAGADVIVARRQRWATTLITRDESAMFVPAERTKSSSDGTFAIRLARGDEVTLRVDAAGFAVWESQSRQAGERVTIRLGRPLTLDVRVTSADGKPVPDAPVRAGIGGEPGNDEFSARNARTNAEGVARFERMPRGARGSMDVRTRSLSLAYKEVAYADAETQTIELTLPAGVVVRGTVIDAYTKTVIARATVKCGEGFGPTTLTDNLGRFEIVGYPKQSVLAEAGGHARGRAKVPSSGDVTIAVEPEGRVAGRVVDADGKPVKDADVALIGNSDMPGGDGSGRASDGGAITGADGTFDVAGLIPGRAHLLRVQAAGHALLMKQIFVPRVEPYSAQLGDVVLVAPHVLRGRVVGADDKPAVRTYVHLAGPDRRDDFVINLHRMTDDLGRFAFGELPPGVYELDVNTGKRRDPTRATVPAAGDGPEIVISLADAKPAEKKLYCRVTVRVVDEQGAPIDGANVQVGYVANSTAGNKKTDREGVATFDAEYQPGTVWVTADPTKWLRNFSWLKPGQTEVTVALRRGTKVSGRVVDDDGAPVNVAWVQAFDGARQVGSSSTKSDGMFAFAVPPGVKIDVEARQSPGGSDHARGAAEAWGVTPGGEEIVLHLVREPATRTLDVEVVDELGAPVVGAMVSTDFQGRDWRSPILGETTADGHARAFDRTTGKKTDVIGLPELPRTPVLVSVTISDRTKGFNRQWSPLPRRVPGDVDAVKIVVGKPRRLHGRVVHEDGSPCASAIVSCTPGSGQGSMNVCESDGAFELFVPADMPTPIDVNAFPAPEAGKIREVTGYDVVDGEDRDLEIVLRPVPKR